MLDLRNLRYFVVLARRLNYIQAADELHISQPTLSRSIQALERQLSIRLLDRDRRGVSLTPQGQFFAEKAAFLLTEAEDLERQAILNSKGEMGKIRFGMAPMPAKALLTDILSDQLRTLPTVTNEVIVRDVEALWSLLVSGEIEFFLSPNRPLHDLAIAKVEFLGDFPLSVLIRTGHPLLNANPPQQRYPLLRSSWTGVAVPHNIQPLVAGSANIVEDFSTLAHVTGQTDALWLSSAYAVRNEIRDGILHEYHRSETNIRVNLYSLARRSLSPLAKSIVQTIRTHITALQSTP